MHNFLEVVSEVWLDRSGESAALPLASTAKTVTTVPMTVRVTGIDAIIFPSLPKSLAEACISTENSASRFLCSLHSSAPSAAHPVSVTQQFVACERGAGGRPPGLQTFGLAQ